MELSAFFNENPKAALAFSGGVDSAYLLCCASKWAKDVTAYYVKSEFQPEFEYVDAQRLAKELGARMKTIELSVLDDENISSNKADRCYHCKKKIFSAIADAAAKQSPAHKSRRNPAGPQDSKCDAPGPGSGSPPDRVLRPVRHGPPPGSAY